MLRALTPRTSRASLLAALRTGALYLTAHANSFPVTTLTCRFSTNAIADIVRRRVASAQLEAERFSGHSLRAGFAAAVVEERAIMKQTRHRSSATVHRYIRDGELFARNLSREVGL